MTAYVQHYVKGNGALDGFWEITDGLYNTLALCRSRTEACMHLALLGKKFAGRPEAFETWTQYYTGDVA